MLSYDDPDIVNLKPERLIRVVECEDQASVLAKLVNTGEAWMRRGEVCQQHTI